MHSDNVFLPFHCPGAPSFSTASSIIPRHCVLSDRRRDVFPKSATTCTRQASCHTQHKWYAQPTPSAMPDKRLTLDDLVVSNPSIVHRRSEQSITASEDYYSLSASSSSSTYTPRHVNDPSVAAHSEATIIRYSTPPSRLRTPAQSRDNLNQVDDGNPNSAALRGLGQRRQSVDSSSSRERNFVHMPAPLNLRGEGGIRRKPVPSTVLENPNSPTQPQESIIAERSHFGSPPTPGPHDEQYVRFALDQLTRDEEVRGSRRYADSDRRRSVNPLYPVTGGLSQPLLSQDAPMRGNEARAAVPTGVPPLNTRHRSKAEQILGEDPTLEDEPDSPRIPTRSPRRKSTPQFFGREPLASPQGPDVFLPCAADESRPLSFLPGILRPGQLGLFITLLSLYLAALVFAAVWSVVNTGLWDYTGFGNGRYFVFNYLPTLLGSVLLLWLFQIQIAVTRISPFLALSSSSQRTRDEGADLQIYQTNFTFPTAFQHFRAGQTMLGLFAFVAWLQIFTLPLLASAFNVYFLGSPEQGEWRWIATQGVIWPVIALYALLLLALFALLIHLHRLRETGMKWDPRTLADLVVLLERSNALADDAELGAETARVGLWRTSHRPNEVFHAYGLAGREARKYSLEDGRITEKSSSQPQQSGGVLSDPEAQRPDTGHWHEKEPERESNEAMLPHRASSLSSTSSNSMISLPWYLRPVFTSLWAITAVVLLLAFLIVSYLPSTRVAAGFNPSIPAPVNSMGYSGTNFLYSFIPAVLGEICLLTWHSFDLAHRRLAPFLALLSKFEGETAERSLLLSYHADLPFHAPLIAAANAHYRTAWFAIVTLLAAALPTLAGGVFWAQFFIPTQSILISAHMPAFYALTVLFTIYALSHLLLLPLSHAERRLANSSSSTNNPGLTFADILSLVRHSRILDDVAFHSPTSKIDLVTRLLSAPIGATLGGRESRLGEAGASLTSLADSIRGFGGARQRALGGLGVFEVPRYAMGRFTGRNGKEYGGIGRVKT